MKKTFLILSGLLVFFCFSCDDKSLDADIAIEIPVTNPTDPTDSETTYSYNLTTNTPFLIAQLETFQY